MGQAVRPFFEYLVLQIAVAVVGVNLVRDKELGYSGLLKCWIFGQMFCFAILQVMAVPMILIRWKLDVLFWSYITVIAVLFGFGLWKLIKKRIRIGIRVPELTLLEMFLLMVAVLLILWQAGIYFFGMHLDEDDARWLAEANDALEYGDMMTRNYDTGDYLGYIQVPKDVTSPWPMMLAIVTRILLTRTAVFAHTVYAPVELLLMYSVYWLMSKELFEKTDARLAFLLSVTVINFFFGKTVFTQSTFSLVRIWQGKATVAAIIIPLLLYLFLRLYRHDTARKWFVLLITGCAACLMSGMGISMAAILIGVYGVWYIVANRKWKRIPMLALSVLPSIVFLLVHAAFKNLY